MAANDLVCVATYRRTVAASLERVWENVLDWEHLPWLHRTSFARVECEGAGDWGWRARIETDSGPNRLELLVERDAGRYVARTLEGRGAGTEIWTRLDEKAQGATDVEVEFCLPGMQDAPPALADGIGDAYVELYTRLWDEDEAMMVHREAALQRPRKAEPERVRVGRLDEIRAALPLQLEVGGLPVRLLELDGELVAHSTVCPHRLGPLDEATPEGARVRCPWHGYEFDVTTGRSCDGRRLRLAPAPRVEIDADGTITLVAD